MTPSDVSLILGLLYLILAEHQDGWWKIGIMGMGLIYMVAGVLQLVVTATR